jgi:predicted small secreted protein
MTGRPELSAATRLPCVDDSLPLRQQQSRDSMLLQAVQGDTMQVFAPMRRNLVRALLSAFVLAGAMTMISACNTTAGLGQDVSATGKAVTTGAEKVKQGL